MTQATAPAADASFDFALLQQSAARTGSRNRRALWWLLGLLALLLASVATLLLYLNNFEAEEATRRRAAEAQWLEQSVQFHFRRLEDDLLVLSRQAVQMSAGVGDPSAGRALDLKAGLLWREPGVILSSGWIGAGQLNDPRVGPERWPMDWDAHPDNAVALALMQSTSQGLRRAAYAGLMLHADGSATDVVWLAVPFFDRGQFAGNYLVAVSLKHALTAVVPGWFKEDHRVQLLTDESSTEADQDSAYRAGLDLPGTDLFVQVALTQAQPTTVPRIFFLVALLFLSGMLVSLYALRRDIIKRQQVQSLLQAQVALRTAMENSVTIGLRAWDLGGNILYVNDAFCRLVGYSAAELIGHTFPFPYWPAEQIDALQRVHDDILAQGTSGEGVEVQFQHADGHLIDVLIHEAPLNTAAGEQIGWMSSVLDISERKRAQRMAAQQQEKLEASGRLVAVGEVASTLAHELNQPLSAIANYQAGCVERLRQGRATPESLIPVMEKITAQAERAGKIVRRVREFVKQSEPVCKPCPPSDIIDAALAIAEIEARRLGSVINVHLAANLPAVNVDPILIEQVLLNLIKNGMEAMQQLPPERRELQISVQRSSSKRVEVAIVDCGHGVPDDIKSQLFDAFFTTKSEGMGMGLNICRSIVEFHQGQLSVEDHPLGGTIFRFTLPVYEP